MALPPISDNERRWLQMIRHAEGTAGPDGYGTTFGYQHFDPSKGHPRRVVKSGGYASDAAGAYQFLSTTWDAAAKGAGVDASSMSPENQDRAALYLIRQRGVDPTQSINPEAVAKLAPEWASLPTLKGNSYYGQPVKSYDSLAKVYGGQLSNPGNTTPTAPATPDSGTGTGTGTDVLPQQTLLGGLMADDSSPIGSLSPLPEPAAPRNPLTLASGLFGTADDAPPVQISRRRINGPATGLAAAGTRMAGSPGPNYFAKLQALTQPPVS